LLAGVSRAGKLKPGCKGSVLAALYTMLPNLSVLHPASSRAFLAVSPVTWKMFGEPACN